MKKYADRKRAEVDEYKVGDTARKLFGWLDKRYNKEYWARLERNWRQWKKRRTKGQRTIETK